MEPLLLPNGVDLLRFAPTGITPPDLRPILARGQPVVGYHGSLARWFDYRLLLDAARARPRWQFVLVGPADFDDAWDRRALAAQENLHWLGPKRHGELPDYLRFFDVATIPFKVNSITRACSPIKLFEFLALGKPVAATALDECRGFLGVHIAESPEDYPGALDRALEASRDPRCAESLRAEAASHTWARRAGELWIRLFGERPPGAGTPPAAGLP